MNSAINLPSPKQIQPSEWEGSKHAQQDLMFAGANQLVFAKPSSLEGLHAVSPTSNHHKDDQTPQAISTLEKPVSPANYQYIKGPEVSINQVTVTFADNQFNIPAGNYYVLNRANRTPMREKGLKDTYEFPGRVWQNNGDEAIEQESQRQKVLLTNELGMTDKEIATATIEPVIRNLAPAAGNSSMLQHISSIDIPQSSVERLIEQYGATYDKENQVVQISRKSDGGIIQGLELIPKDKILNYLSQKSKEGNAIASSTYAGLALAA